MRIIIGILALIASVSLAMGQATTPVVVAGSAYSAPVIMQNAATGSGNGTVLSLSNGAAHYSTVFINVTCVVACSGGTTVNFQGTDSTGNFFSISGTPVGGGAAVTSATASGQFVFSVAGLVSVRATISGYSAGTVTVTGVAVASTGGAGVSSSGGGGGGGGAVTMASGAVSSGAYVSGSLVDGSIVTLGTTTDATCANDTTSGCSIEQRLQRIAQNLTTLNTTSAADANIATIRSGAVVSGAYASGSIGSGAMVDLGAKADSAAGTDTATASLIALVKRNNQNLTTLNTPFAPGAAYAQLTATGSSASVALPTGASVVVQNIGTSAVSCNLSVGSGTAIAGQNIIQPSSWAGYGVGSNTFINCIDQTGSASNVVVISGGTNVPTGSGGGGGGGGGGGAVTIADGADVTKGSTSDATCGGDTTSGCTVEQRLQRIAQNLTTVNTTAGAALAAGTNDIGTIGVHGISAVAATASENPIYDGCRAQNAEQSAVSNGQKIGFSCSLPGKLINLPFANPENTEYANPAAITDNSQHQLFAAAAAGVRHYVTDCLVTNSSLSVVTVVQIQDGSTVLVQGVAFSDGGGFAFNPPVPRRGSTATALNVQALTTGANIIVSCAGFQGT